MPRDLQPLATRAYKLTDTGVAFRRPLTVDEFEALGQLLARISNFQPWAIGDWLLAGEHMWNDGERYRLAMQMTGQRLPATYFSSPLRLSLIICVRLSLHAFYYRNRFPIDAESSCGCR